MRAYAIDMDLSLGWSLSFLKMPDALIYHAIKLLPDRIVDVCERRNLREKSVIVVLQKPCEDFARKNFFAEILCRFNLFLYFCPVFTSEACKKQKRMGGDTYIEKVSAMALCSLTR